MRDKSKYKVVAPQMVQLFRDSVELSHLVFGIFEKLKVTLNELSQFDFIRRLVFTVKK